jgi:hypothetical protein
MGRSRLIKKYPLVQLDVSVYNTEKFDELINKTFPEDNQPNQPFLGIIVSEKVFQRLIKHAETIQQDEQYLREKALKKWIYPQGGHFSLAQLSANLDQYALILHRDKKLVMLIKDYATMVFRRELPKVTQQDFIITSSVELYNTYQPTHSSVAGWTAVGDRRDHETRATAVRQAVVDPFNFDPIIVGMRLKDSKYRNIFIDSIANYFRESRVFKRLFSLIEELPSNTAEHHYDTAKEVLRVHAEAAYGGDYKAMDQHDGLDDLEDTVDLAAEIFDIPEEDVLQMKQVLRKLLTTKLIVGNEVWESVWNMLSGIFPTHDMESLRNMSILIAALTSLSIRVIMTPRKLKSREAYLKVCGDDIIVLFGPDHPTKEAVVEAHARFAAACGQELEAEKADWVEKSDKRGIFYCKRMFALDYSTPGYIMSNSNMDRFVYPKYSIEKALNGIYHPEHIPTFNDKRSLIYWVQSVMDNAAGHTAFKRILFELFDSNKFFQDPTLLTYSLPTEDMAIIMKRWQNRQYGLVGQTDSPFWCIFKMYLQSKKLI